MTPKYSSIRICYGCLSKRCRIGDWCKPKGALAWWAEVYERTRTPDGEIGGRWFPYIWLADKPKAAKGQTLGGLVAHYYRAARAEKREYHQEIIHKVWAAVGEEPSED